MTLYRRWVVATIGAALAAFLVTIPIYRHAAAIGATDGLSAWTLAGSLIELGIFVLVTYWALAPVFPRLSFSRYASWTVLPMLIGYLLFATFVPVSKPDAPETASPDPAIVLANLAVIIPVIGALVAAQWLALKDACEGHRAWIAWTFAAMLAYFTVGDLFNVMAGGSLLAKLSTPGEQIAAYAAAVAAYAVFGIVSGFGVAQLREKV